METREASPMVITGITNTTTSMTIPPKPTAAAQDRTRVQVELSASVSLLLDHVCEVTGANKSQVVLSALVDALPGLLERSEAIQKRSLVLSQPAFSKKR